MLVTSSLDARFNSGSLKGLVSELQMEWVRVDRCATGRSEAGQVDDSWHIAINVPYLLNRLVGFESSGKGRPVVPYTAVPPTGPLPWAVAEKLVTGWIRYQAYNRAPAGGPSRHPEGPAARVSRPNPPGPRLRGPARRERLR